MPLFKRNKPEDEAHGDPLLVVICIDGHDDQLPNFAYPIGPGAETIGRDETCTIQILDDQISRKQLAIAFDSAHRGFVATDMGSRNGTLINDQPLTTPRKLDDGDVITMGNSKLIYTTRRFPDHASAFTHFKNKRAGEQYRATMPGE